MKKLAILLGGLASVITCASGGVISLLPAYQEVTTNSTVDIAIRVDGIDANTAISAFNIDVQFDPSLLMFFTFSWGDSNLSPSNQLSLVQPGVGDTTTPVADTVNTNFTSLDDSDTLLAQQEKGFTMVTLTFMTLSAGTAQLILNPIEIIDANNPPQNIASAFEVANATLNIVYISPEPSTWFLGAIGLAALGLLRRRRAA